MVQAFGPDDVLPDAATDPVRLPRPHGEASAQGLAVTLLADYNLRQRVWLPSGAVLELLSDFGLSQAGARTTVSRLARRGVLETGRDGRRAQYRLTGPAAASLASGGRQIAAFAADAERWDGHWTIVAFRVPQEQDTQRRALRGRLRWLGYAPLYDALWISPNPLSERATAILAELSLGAMTSFRAQHTAQLAGRRHPLDAWDVNAIAAQYHAFLERWAPLRHRLTAGSMPGAEAVWARTAVMDGYRQFVVLDPPLPIHEMPPGWPRAEARQLFVALYDGLAEPALDHVRVLAAQHDKRPRPDILTHTVSDLLVTRVEEPARTS